MDGTAMKDSVVAIVVRAMSATTDFIKPVMKITNHGKAKKILNEDLNMNKRDAVVYFLGQLQAIIEQLSIKAGYDKNTMFDDLTELEQFFNENIERIFSQKQHEEFKKKTRGHNGRD